MSNRIKDVISENVFAADELNLIVALCQAAWQSKSVADRKTGERIGRLEDKARSLLSVSVAKTSGLEQNEAGAD